MSKTQRVYLDTSVLIAMVSHEAETPQLMDWYGRTPDELISSPWLRTELASALSIKQRMRVLSPAAVRSAHTQAQEILADTRCVDITPDDFDRAAQLCADAKARLRAPDALHLAVAARSGCQALATLDADMGKAARKLGLAPIAF